jgi:hypothetical protein
VFEVGKTYFIKAVNGNLSGELTIQEKLNIERTKWRIFVKLDVDVGNFLGDPLVDWLKNFSWDLIAPYILHELVFRKVILETEEGYICIDLFHKRPKYTVFKNVDSPKESLLIENLTIKYADNLDVVEKLGEKFILTRNQ